MSPDAVTEWLDAVLREPARLDRAVPDEGVAGALRRLDTTLGAPARQDLRAALLALTRRWMREPGESDAYVDGLLHAVLAFDIKDAGPYLAGFVAGEPFAGLTPAQRRAVVAALHDLRTPLAADAWEALARRHPELGVLAFSGLAERQPKAAGRVARVIAPERADELWVALAALDETLSASALEALAGELRGGLSALAPDVQSAVKEWLAGKLPATRRLDGLHAALRGFFGQTYQPSPCSARL